ncbi:MAG TPA: hypothetical protein VIL46_12930, partial [Gemmataceae bacterium]
MRCATFLALALLAAPAFAQDDLSVLRPDKDDVPPRKMLYEYLRAQAAKHFEARRKAIAAIKTPDDLRRRQHE